MTVNRNCRCLHSPTGTPRGPTWLAARSSLRAPPDTPVGLHSVRVPSAIGPRIIVFGVGDGISRLLSPLTSGLLLTPAFLHLLRTASALLEHRTPEVTADTLIPPMALPMLLISVPSWAVAAPTGCPPSPLRTVPLLRVPLLIISRPATILSHSALSSAKATVDRNRRCLHSQFDTPFAARLGSLLAPPSLPPSHHRTGDTARHSLLPMPLPLAFRKRCFLSPSLQSLFKG